jgi:hypothetical protein
VGYYSRTGTGGGGNKTLVESWDGAHWSIVPSPNPPNSPVLSGVSCVSAVACTAAGFTFRNAVYKTVIESGAASG